MQPNLQLFNSLRVNGILQNVIQDPRLLPAPMVWESRIPDTQAPEEEIMARFYGVLLMADLIADDAKAGTYNIGAWQFETNKVPNIKTGVAMNQSTINMLQRIQQYGSNSFDMNLFNNWQTDAVVRAITGVRQRKELLRIAMLTDGLLYDRLGIKITGGGWGMPADLKVTSSPGWASTSGIGLTEIMTLRRVGRGRYNKNYNRATMSTGALQAIQAQLEFQAQVKAFGYGFGGIPIPAIPLQNESLLVTLVEKLITGADTNGGGGGQFKIEIDDRRFWQQDASGKITNGPSQQLNKVILTDSADDGNRFVWDFAQGVVTESILAGIVPMNVVGGMEMGYGPMGYVTAADASANPPGLVHWAVDRGFPRRKDLAASAVIDIGTIVDPISTSVPFPS